MSTNHHQIDPTNYFKVHIEPAAQPHHHAPKEPEHKVHTPESGQNEEKRTLKSILKDATRQIVASAVILVLGIIILNWSAYFEIAQNEWAKFTGTVTESPLNELVEEKSELINQNLKVSNDPELQKKQIPALNLEIAPVDNRLIIPRINKNIPIVRVSSESLIRRDWNALEKEMQSALKGGVVHYPGTSIPGEGGNMAITGHSSYFPWDPGRFKDVFALLHDVYEGDKIVVYWDQKKYIYEVTEKKIVLPEDIQVLKQTPGEQITLITCTPVGTNLKRLIIVAKPVKEEPVETVSEGIAR